MAITRREFLKGAGIFTLDFVLKPIETIAKYQTPVSEKSGTSKEEKEFEPKELECPIDYWHEVQSQFRFENYIDELRKEGFYPITLSDVANYFSTGQKCWPENERPRVITFDDGLLSQYQNAVPVLDKWKIRGTFACMADWQGDGTHRHMSNKQIREISLYWEIASHTGNHPNLPKLREKNLGAWQAEIVDSRRILEEIIGKEVRSFVYPFGAFDRETVELVSKYYKIAAATGGGILLKRGELFKIPRQRKS